VIGSGAEPGRGAGLGESSGGWSMRTRLLAVVAAVALAACASTKAPSRAGGSPAGTGSPSASPSAPACGKDSLPLVTPGRLTIATDSPVYPPWFEDNDPTNGRGFEGAVAYAVAKAMGFGAGEVTWTVEPFNKSYAPGPKSFDFDINEISITPARQKVVTFSEGYYDVNQAVVALKKDPISKVTGLADLKGYKLGAQVGTTSLAYIQEQIQPAKQPFVYDTTNDAKTALQGGQIDGIVVDLPTAFFISAAEIPGSVVVGQFPNPPGSTPEQFGLLFEKDNPLADCVNAALTRLKGDGTLDQIQKTWLSDKVNAPVLG
jgi:polar amino acid transport system substrate-binding protein